MSISDHSESGQRNKITSCWPGGNFRSSIILPQIESDRNYSVELWNTYCSHRILFQFLILFHVYENQTIKRRWVRGYDHFAHYSWSGIAIGQNFFVRLVNISGCWIWILPIIIENVYSYFRPKPPCLLRKMIFFLAGRVRGRQLPVLSVKNRESQDNRQ